MGSSEVSIRSGECDKLKLPHELKVHVCLCYYQHMLLSLSSFIFQNFLSCVITSYDNKPCGKKAILTAVSSVQTSHKNMFKR